jgi:hypothetical protein
MIIIVIIIVFMLQVEELHLQVEEPLLKCDDLFNVLSPQPLKS